MRSSCIFFSFSYAALPAGEFIRTLLTSTTATRAGALCANIGAASAATASEMSTFFMKISLSDWALDKGVIALCLVGIPDGEVEGLELVRRLRSRIDGVDETDRKLEHGQENAELGARRIAD